MNSKCIRNKDHTETHAESSQDQKEADGPRHGQTGTAAEIHVRKVVNHTSIKDSIKKKKKKEYLRQAEACP